MPEMLGGALHSIGQLFIALGSFLPAAVRWLVLVSATILVLFAAGIILQALWAPVPDEVAVQPFVVVDPSGNLKNADSGFAQMLVAHIDRLKPGANESQKLLERSRAAESIAGSGQTSETYGAPAPKAPLEGIVADHKQALPEVKLQGVDIAGVLSWIKAQFAPKARSLSFTAYVADNGVAIGGDIRALNIEGESSVWIPPMKGSPVEALDQLAWQLLQLKIGEKDIYLRRLPPQDFRGLINRLSQAADKRIYSEPERKKHFTSLYAYFTGLLGQADDWRAMMILSAEAARLAEDYDNARKYYRMALEQEQKLSPRDENRIKRIEGSIAKVEVAIAAQSRVTATAAMPIPDEVPVRLFVDQLDAAAVQSLRDGFQALYDAKGQKNYSAIAGLYGAPGYYSWHHSQNNRSALRLNLFLPWNRAYLAHFERAARDLVGSFRLACWDWTKGSIPDAFAEKNKPGGGPNPLYAARIDVGAPGPTNRGTTTRHFGGALPTASDIASVMAREDWTDFSFRLEILSDQVHGSVGGDMGMVATSAFDPLFYAHRCSVDRVWAKWQQAHDTNTIDKQLMDVELVPFGIKVRDVLDTQKLGYKYD